MGNGESLALVARLYYHGSPARADRVIWKFVGRELGNFTREVKMKDDIIKGLFIGLICVLAVVGLGSLIGFTFSTYEMSPERMAAERGEDYVAPAEEEAAPAQEEASEEEAAPAEREASEEEAAPAEEEAGEEEAAPAEEEATEE